MATTKKDEKKSTDKKTSTKASTTKKNTNTKKTSTTDKKETAKKPSTKKEDVKTTKPKKNTTKTSSTKKTETKVDVVKEVNVVKNDVKERKKLTKLTVSKFIEQLQSLPQAAEVLICGENIFFLHIEKDKSVVCFDTEDLEDVYIDDIDTSPDDFWEKISKIFMYQMNIKNRKCLKWKIVHRVLSKMI